MDETFVKLFRKFTKWEWYDDIPTKVLFIHLLLKANFKDKKWRGIEIKRGQILTSIGHLAKETSMTTQKTRTALEKLERTHEINKQTTSQYTIIELNNYNAYQSNNKRITNEQQTSNKRATTTKERKEGKERKECYGEFKNVKLSDEEKLKLEKYTNGQTDDYIEKLSIYLEQSGKKYKSHYATIQGFYRRDNPKKNNKALLKKAVYYFCEKYAVSIGTLKKTLENHSYTQEDFPCIASSETEKALNKDWNNLVKLIKKQK